MLNMDFRQGAKDVSAAGLCFIYEVKQNWICEM